MSMERFDLVPMRGERISAKLLYISRSKYEGDWNSVPHAHYFAELFYITGGVGNFVLEGKSFEVHRDDLIIINPDVNHTELSVHGSPLEYIVLGIEGLSFLFPKKGEEITHMVRNYRSQREKLLFYLDNLISEIETKSGYYEMVCQNFLELLLTCIMRDTDFAVSQHPLQKSKQKYCCTVKQYIDDNFKQDITLDQLAGLVHMNKYHLVHTFSKETGISPINYLITKRIDESIHLLETTNHTIAEISDIVGFSSQSYFCQSFKRLKELSPNAYRKQFQQKQRVLNG